MAKLKSIKQTLEEKGLLQSNKRELKMTGGTLGLKIKLVKTKDNKGVGSGMYGEGGYGSQTNTK